MTTRAAIDDFLAQKNLAIVGISPGGKKFGNLCFKEMKAKRYRLYLVNPNAKEIYGQTCYPNLGALPEPVGGVLIAVHPEQTEQVVKDAAEAGITRVWMQTGAKSEKALQFCKENNINAIRGECILMFAEPLVFYHRMHRWINKLFGRHPR